MFSVDVLSERGWVCDRENVLHVVIGCILHAKELLYMICMDIHSCGTMGRGGEFEENGTAVTVPGRRVDFHIYIYIYIRVVD